MKRIFSYPTLSSFAYSLQIITQKINGKLNFQLQYITHPTYILHIHYISLAPHATVFKVREFLGWQYEIEEIFGILQNHLSKSFYSFEKWVSKKPLAANFRPKLDWFF